MNFLWIGGMSDIRVLIPRDLHAGLLESLCRHLAKLKNPRQPSILLDASSSSIRTILEQQETVFWKDERWKVSP